MHKRGTLIVTLVAVLLLSGCDLKVGSGTGSSPTTTSVQLAIAGAGDLTGANPDESGCSADATDLAGPVPVPLPQSGSLGNLWLEYSANCDTAWPVIRDVELGVVTVDMKVRRDDGLGAPFHGYTETGVAKISGNMIAVDAGSGCITGNAQVMGADLAATPCASVS